MKLQGISDNGMRRLAQALSDDEQQLGSIEVGTEDLSDYEKDELLPYWSEEEISLPATYDIHLVRPYKDAVPRIIVEGPNRVYWASFDVESGAVAYDFPEYIPQKVQNFVEESYETVPGLMAELEAADKDFNERWQGAQDFENSYKR